MEKLKQFIESIKGFWLVAAFLCLLIVGLCSEANAETHIEAGPTFLSHDYGKGGMLIFNERVGKFDFGIGYVSKQYVVTRNDGAYNLKENIFIHAQRIVPYKRLELAIGPAYFQNTNRALGKRFTIGLVLGYKINDRATIKVRHWSNAGSGTPNMGQDALTVSWAF